MARIFDEKGTMHMNSRYDVAILGCGEAGIFAGYELMLRNPGLKVVALDQGADIYSRSCPIVAGKVKECIHCKVCDTMCGFGGDVYKRQGNIRCESNGRLTSFVISLPLYKDCLLYTSGWGFDPILADEENTFRAVELLGTIAMMLTGAFPMVRCG